MVIPNPSKWRLSIRVFSADNSMIFDSVAYHGCHVASARCGRHRIVSLKSGDADVLDAQCVVYTLERIQRNRECVDCVFFSFVNGM